MSLPLSLAPLADIYAAISVLLVALSVLETSLEGADVDFAIRLHENALTIGIIVKPLPFVLGAVVKGGQRSLFALRVVVFYSLLALGKGF